MKTESRQLQPISVPGSIGADEVRARWRFIDLRPSRTGTQKVPVPAPPLVDALALVLAAVITQVSSGSLGMPVHGLGWSLAFPAVTFAVIALRGQYRPRIGPHFLDQVRRALEAAAAAAVLVTFARVVIANGPQVGSEAIQAFLIQAALLTVLRGAAHVGNVVNLKQGGGAPTLILGAGRVGHLIAARLLARPQLGLRPVGFVDDLPYDVEDASAVPVLGSTKTVEDLVRSEGITHAILSFSTAHHEADLAISRRLRELGVAISVVPRLFEDLSDWIEVNRVAGLPLLTTYPSRSHSWLLAFKYALDPLMAIVALVLTAPVMALAALATRLSAGSPVLFRQVRTGHDGRPFEIFKFRTMRGDPARDGEADTEWAAAIAEGRALNGNSHNGHDSALSSNGLGGAGSLELGDRTTRVGYLLRRFGIDELPQLFNVARGQMSMVGPRPERQSYVDRFEGTIHRYAERHRMKPGITGWAQVNGLRGPTSLADRVEWDNYYIQNWSVWLDIKIVLMTFVAIFRSKHVA